MHSPTACQPRQHKKTWIYKDPSSHGLRKSKYQKKTWSQKALSSVPISNKAASKTKILGSSRLF
jgi:hypothetical protein